MKKIWTILERKGINLFWIIPILVIISIIVGYFCNISSLNEIKPAIKGEFYDLTDLWKLEILPFITLLFSIYLIAKIALKKKAYTKTLPKTKNKGLNLLEWLKISATSYLKLPKRLFIPWIAYRMLFMWSIGWGLYIIALWSNYGKDGNIAEVLGYSAVASLDMFLLDINGNIIDNIGNSIDGFNGSVIKGGIIITSIFAAILSFSIVIKLFLNRLLSALHASKAYIDDNHNHIYIFWGVNDKTVTLANSIKENDIRSYIIYVENIDSESNETDGVANIINFVSPSNSKIESIDTDERTLFLYSTADLTEVKTDINLWSHIGLEQVERLFIELSEFTPQEEKGVSNITSKTDDNIKNQIHIFFISEDRDKNISNGICIADNFIHLSERNIEFKHIEKKIYCQTRRDSVTSIIEDSRTNLDNNTEVIVIDESNLVIIKK